MQHPRSRLVLALVAVLGCELPSAEGPDAPPTPDSPLRKRADSCDGVWVPEVDRALDLRPGPRYVVTIDALHVSGGEPIRFEARGAAAKLQRLRNESTASLHLCVAAKDTVEGLRRWSTLMKSGEYGLLVRTESGPRVLAFQLADFEAHEEVLDSLSVTLKPRPESVARPPGTVGELVPDDPRVRQRNEDARRRNRERAERGEEKQRAIRGRPRAYLGAQPSEDSEGQSPVLGSDDAETRRALLRLETGKGKPPIELLVGPSVSVQRFARVLSLLHETGQIRYTAVTFTEK